MLVVDNGRGLRTNVMFPQDTAQCLRICHIDFLCSIRDVYFCLPETASTNFHTELESISEISPRGGRRPRRNFRFPNFDHADPLYHTTITSQLQVHHSLPLQTAAKRSSRIYSAPNMYIDIRGSPVGPHDTTAGGWQRKSGSEMKFNSRGNVTVGRRLNAKGAEGGWVDERLY